MLLLAASCTTDLNVHSGEPESVLVLNSTIRTCNAEHYADVSVSRLREGVEMLSDATLDVYINGEYRCSAHYYTPDTYPNFSPIDYGGVQKFMFKTGYYFNADLHEGDEVRLEASWGGLRASASVTVPEALELLAVDTVTVKTTPYFDNMEGLECKLKFRDIPGQDNYLRLLASYHQEVVDHAWHDGVSVDTLSMYHTEEPFNFFFDDDEILRGDFHSSREQEAIRETDLNLPLVTNKFCIFTDEGFKDSDYTATTYIRKSFYEPPQEMFRSRTVTSNLTFILLTLSKDDYLLHRAYTNADTNGLLNSGDWITQILFEPVTFPSNVEGGLGFVCVEAASSVRLDFPVREIPEYSAKNQSK